MTMKTDLLDRESECTNVIQLLNYYSENHGNACFAINGQWGIGKTYLLEQIRNRICADNLTIYYNCWENDYYEEPLVAILAVLAQEMVGDDTPKRILAAGQTVVADFLEAADGIANHFLGIKPFCVTDQVTHAGEALKYGDVSICELDSNHLLNQQIHETKKCLAKIAKRKNIVIFVDELDRCLPEYAIKVLERLHHFFHGIPNLAVVMAVNHRQLENTVMTIFGKNTNVEEYLRKFIDFELKLEKGNLNEKLDREMEGYLSWFEGTEEDRKFAVSLIGKTLSGIDMRTREKLLARAELIHRVYIGAKADYSVLCFEVFWIVMVQYYAIYKRDIMENMIVIKKPFQGFTSMAYSELRLVNPGAEFQKYYNEIFKTIQITNMTGKQEYIRLDSDSIPTRVFAYWMQLSNRNRPHYEMMDTTAGQWFPCVRVYDEMVKRIR